MDIVEEATEKIKAILRAVYEEGFGDGESKQAILEIRGRERFLESLKNETNQPLDMTRKAEHVS